MPSDETLTRAQLSRRLRHHMATQLYDESGTAIRNTAIYALTDPRTLREPRYIGQTSDPQRRFFQHLNTARLWLPDETPWWVQSPRLRPLYHWIRSLYRDDGRLPTMVIREWVGSSDDARLAERAQICACLANQQQLLNVEPRLNGQQLLLL